MPMLMLSQSTPWDLPPSCTSTTSLRLRSLTGGADIESNKFNCKDPIAANATPRSAACQSPRCSWRAVGLVG